VLRVCRGVLVSDIRWMREDLVFGGRPEFVTTHWSRVVAAAEGLSEESRRALDDLCRAYWYPLYAYVRRVGHDPEEARDLTQAFLAQLLEKQSLRLANPERGRFRTFLLTALKHFLVDQVRRNRAQKRGGGAILEPLDAGGGDEERYQHEPVELDSPDVLYDRSWATAVLERALSRLRQEYSTTRHGPSFDALKEYVWGERSGTSCAELGREIGLSEEAAKKAVQRLRQRFGQHLRDQISETVTTPAELQEELLYLYSLLG
jgi:RNA polymerase sigma factor (sigma-70 family)